MSFSDILLNIINAGMTTYINMFFLYSFAESRLSRLWQTLYAIAVTSAFAAVLTFTAPGLIRTLILLAFPIITALPYRLKWYSKALMSLMYFALQSIAELATTALLSIIFSVDTQTAIQGAFLILGIILSKLISLLAVIAIRMRRRTVFYGTSAKKVITLFLIPASTIAVLIIYCSLFIQLPVESSSITLPALICFAILTLSNMIVFDLVDRLYRDAEKDVQLATARGLVRSQAEQYQQLIAHNSDVLKIRHDQKNFVIGLISELEARNYDRALSSLREEYHMLIAPAAADSGDGVVGAVVRAKQQACANHGIIIDGQYKALASIAIPAVDLAILLGNALDNAIEATRQVASDAERRISLTVKVHNDQLLISIKNPAVADIDENNPVSTKRRDGSHGFGILSMKNIAAKYGGQVIFNYADGVFETNLLLSNKVE